MPDVAAWSPVFKRYLLARLFRLHYSGPLGPHEGWIRLLMQVMRPTLLRGHGLTEQEALDKALAEFTAHQQQQP